MLRLVLLLLSLSTLAACGSRLMRYPEGKRPPDCPRGQPKPLLGHGNPELSMLYYRDTGPGRATETARLAGGTGLVIRHTGCDSISHDFLFELRGLPAPVESRREWYSRAARLLERLAAGSPDEEGLRIMARKLDAASADAPPYDTPLALDDFQSVSLRVTKEDRPERTRVEFRYDFKH